MLKRVVVTNHLGESIEYKIDGVQAENESGLIIASIDGLGPVKANINMSDILTSDGSIFNSARLTNRNVVITAIFTHVSSIEEARLLSYKYFPVKKKITLTIETDNREGAITGWVESNEPSIFSSSSACQVSILCEDAYISGEVVHEDFVIDQNLGSCTVEYEGENNLGIELSFHVADEVNELSVTKIDAIGEEIGSMSFDFSKMSGVVPNSSPTNVPSSDTSFMMTPAGEQRTFKYMADIPARKSNFHGKDMIAFTHGSHECDLFRVGGINVGTGDPYFEDVIAEHWRYSDEYKKWVKMPNPTIEVPTESDMILPVDPNHYLTDIQWGIYDKGNNKFIMCVFLYDMLEDVAKLIYEYDGINNVFRITARLDTLTQSPLRGKSTACYDSDRIHIIYNATSPLYIFHAEYYPSVSRVSYIGGSRYATTRTGGRTEFTADISIAIVLATSYDHLLHIYPGEASYEVNRHYTWPLRTPGSDFYTMQDTDNYGLHISYASVCDGYSSIQILDQIDGIVGLYSYIRDSNYTGHYSIRYDQVMPDDYYSFRIMQSDLHDDNFALFSADAYPSYTETPNNTRLIENDELVVNTKNGEKSVTLRRHGEEYNAINSLGKNPTWFRVERPTNWFAFETDQLVEGVQSIGSASIDTTTLYEGM